MSVTCSYATVYHGRILTQYEFISGNLQVSEWEHSVFERFSKLRPKPQDRRTIDKQEQIILLSKIDSEINDTKANKTAVDGYTQVYIENFSAQNQTYQVSIHFCIMGLSKPTCYRSDYEVELEPEGFLQLLLKKRFKYNFEHAGEYGSHFFLDVYNENTRSNVSTFDMGSIIISNQ